LSENSLSLGFSPCPNDTFIFHGFVHGLAEKSGLRIDPPILADVETLNEWALQARLDISKVSFHALGHILDEYVLLNSGGALGRGCGPLLVASEHSGRRNLTSGKIAIPGHYTTAAMLLRLFAPDCKNLVPMRFDEIIPALVRKEVDAGVIIHESRFTYKKEGLVKLKDLGTWWEEISGCPVPLGGIVARRSLGPELLKLIDQGIRESVKQAYNSPEKCKQYVRSNAQELEDEVLSSHIKLYVNDFSMDFGKEGLEAIIKFLEMGMSYGVFPADSINKASLTVS